MPNWTKLAMRTLLGKRLPIVEGEIEVNGIDHELTIRRDTYGIPYIEANSTLDAWYGLGYCHGQDRTFQLEMLLRLTRGTLSELIGKAGIPMDRLSRRIGFRHYAEVQSTTLEKEDHALLSAYCRGIWEGNQTGCANRPHEFALLRSRPTPWHVDDVLAAINYVAFALSTWGAKLSRLLIWQADGAEAVSALDGGYGEWMPVSRPAGGAAAKVIDQLGQDLRLLSGALGPGGASNNWAIHGSRTATGRPLLANDPHLAPTLPAPWYLAHIRAPEWCVAGASFIGLPIIAAGHNEHAAWGVTAGLADNLDLYLEHMGDDGKSVRESEAFIACDIRREVIKVKGADDVVEEILVTPRGPIISPVFEAIPMAISLKATWHQPGLVRNFRRYHHAASFDEFRTVVLSSAVASLNMVYADRDDNIGWQLVGQLPLRGGAHGTVPTAGWAATQQWGPDGVPGNEMPFLANPETGFVATANNKPTRDGDGPYLGRDWAEGYRLARISEALKTSQAWDIEACQQLQMDQLAVAWREIRQSLLEMPQTSAEMGRAIQLLRDWDGKVSKESVAASVYQFFLAEMVKRIVEVKAPNAFVWGMGRGFHPAIPTTSFSTNRISQLSRLLREQPEGWLPLPWPDEVAAALERSIVSLKRSFTEDEGKWAWGSVRPLTLIHPLGQRRPLSRIFNIGPLAMGGDGQTVAQTGRDLADPTANPDVIANLRMVLDIGNWDDNRFILAGGQSGNPFSRHYADMLPLWLEGSGVTMAWSETAVKAATTSVLSLVPC